MSPFQRNANFLYFVMQGLATYAATLYLRIEAQNSISVNLAFSKMRLISKVTGKKDLEKDIHYHIWN